jgi:hypothetical protein
MRYCTLLARIFLAPHETLAGWSANYPKSLLRNGHRIFLTTLAAACLTTAAFGAERDFNFGEYPVGETPSNFLSTVTGEGQPGSWKIILDETPSAMPARDPKAPAVTERAVLAQLSRSAVDAHFPVLVLNDDTFNDFTFSTRFKIVGGAMAEMAGVVFRYQDEKNYYVLMASALDNRFWFFKIVNGIRSKLIGPPIDIPKNEWHGITVQCEGNHIHCQLDGKEIIPMITDTSFSGGKVGFWTKSDSVSYFADAKLEFTPRETLAQSLVSDTLKKFSKLEDLKIFAVPPGGHEPQVVAGKDEKDIHQPGGDAERDVIHNGKSYFGRNKKRGTVVVTVPLRDRNGEPIAAVVFEMKSFPGEMEDTAALKAQAMMKTMQPRVTSLEDLLQ